MIAANDTEKRELVLGHLPLARRLARRYAGPAHANEDLAQVAYLGLVKAVDRFDPERGLSVASYAIPTILGELKRYFRDTRWALHVPRELQERAVRIERELDELTRASNRTPTLAEVAAHAGVSVEEVIEAREASRSANAVSLDAPAPGDEDGESCLLDSLGDRDPGYEVVEDIASLGPAVAELDRRARLVLRLRFVDDLNQTEIAARIGVSQMHVSRILSRALDELREAVAVPAG